jgi:hypothetical protein
MAGIEPGVHKKVEIPVVNPDTLDKESKAEFLKRRAAEDKILKKSNKIIEEWYCKSQNGNKVLRKVLKANGGIYSFFLFRIDKNKKMFEDHYKSVCKSYDYVPEKKAQRK